MTTDAWIHEVERQASARAARLHPRSPHALTVLFDPLCALCLRCRAWMLGQPTYVTLRFLACTEAEAREQFGDLPWLGDELIVVGDGGEVWVGPAAFLTCLWALVEWRAWSYRLAGPTFSVLAERFFLNVSNHRRALAAFLRHDDACDDGSCRVGGAR